MNDLHLLDLGILQPPCQASKLSTMVNHKLLVLGAALLACLECHKGCHAFSPATSRSLSARPLKSTKFFPRPLAATTIEPPKVPVTTEDAAVLEPKDNRILGQPIPYNDLTIGVMKETFKGENRVSQTPDSIKMLVKEGFHVVVQSGGTNSC